MVYLVYTIFVDKIAYPERGSLCRKIGTDKLNKALLGDQNK